jgi:murein DD-endopeptidase MepM/ murein hydrolase activator NlpD
MEEMNEFETKPRGTFWRDWGVYGALALCLAIIGAAVALTSLPEKEEAQERPAQHSVSEAPRQDPLPVNKPIIPQETGLPVIRILPTASPEPVAPQQAEATVAPNKSAGASSEKRAQAPVSGKVIWGYAADKLIYSKTLDQWTTHKAVDIACPQGTAVKCVLGGTVEKVYTDDQLGVTVIVKHSSDRKTLYANLNETVPVKAGDKVNAGTVLGTVGKTAISECAQESHLHFAFFVKGKAVDPTSKVRLG